MKAQPSLLSSDIISTLPAEIIETILCLLPTKEAARTSVLSRDWRYKWTKISKLEFNMESFAISSRRGYFFQKRRLFNAIRQVVLQHPGLINELTLSAFPNNNRVEIDEVILHLSRRNTVKKLRLSYFSKLPLSVFSFHKLTELYLHKCYFLHQPRIFDGFGSLTTLHLELVNISNKTLLRLLSKCPLLKSFTLLEYYNNTSSDDESTLIELFECFRVIENLTMCVWGFQLKCFRQLPHSRELATSLLHLKYICIKAMYVIEKDGYGLPFLLLLIRSSPNLEKIKLQITPLRYDKLKMDSSYASMMDGSDIKLEHLIELEIEEEFCDLKHELEFVKIILANSPVLKKVRIIFTERVGFHDEELLMKISRIVLSFPCASTGVKIIIDSTVYFI